MLLVREWLSGGVSPCQGEGRGFESRLVLKKQKDSIKKRYCLFVFGAPPRSEVRMVYVPLRSSQNRHPLDVVRRLVLSMIAIKRNSILTPSKV